MILRMQAEHSAHAIVIMNACNEPQFHERYLDTTFLTTLLPFLTTFLFLPFLTTFLFLPFLTTFQHL